MQTTAVVAGPLFAGLQFGAHVREQRYRNYLSTITGFVDLSKTVIEMKSEHESNFIAARRTPASLAWTLALCALIGGAVRAPALDVTSMKAAATYSAARRGTALLIVQDGRRVFESYPGNHSAQETHKIYSGTKGFWVLAALAAEEEGILKLDERVAETIDEWRKDDRKARITIRELLNFTCGLEPMSRLHGDTVPDRNAVALRLPVVAAPGERFIYGPSPLQVFDELFRRKLALHRETPTHYLERKVLKPLGLGPQIYKSDRAGNPLLATGFRLTAEQWSRIGRLILSEGAPVVSRRALSQCLRGTKANPAFGMGFWNNRAAGPGAREFDIEDMLERDWWKQEWHSTCLSREAPTDMIASVGSGYQRLIVIPSMELIIVRLGQDAKFSDGDFLRILLGRRAAAEPRSVHLDSISAEAAKAVVRRNTEEVHELRSLRGTLRRQLRRLYSPAQLLSRSRRCTKPISYPSRCVPRLPRGVFLTREDPV
jgi:CubicO group peptidase (beta-lactamase class C family)